MPNAVDAAGRTRRLFSLASARELWTPVTPLPSGDALLGTPAPDDLALFTRRRAQGRAATAAALATPSSPAGATASCAPTRP